MSTQCKSVLLIEDDDDIRNMIALALESEGYTVFQAANGRAGLDLLNQPDIHPCLILLDVMMPVLNGWEFLKQLKEGNADILAPLPIYVISAAGEHADLARKQATGFIKKPLDLDYLYQIVEKYCK